MRQSQGSGKWIASLREAAARKKMYNKNQGRYAFRKGSQATGR
jgi:hypothetical protein